MSYIPEGELETAESNAARPVDVLVVGAGPVGLFTACEMRRFGLTVRIVDYKHDCTPPAQSRALALHARTLEAMQRHKGVVEALQQQGNQVSGLSLHVDGLPCASLSIPELNGLPPSARCSASSPATSSGPIMVPRRSPAASQKASSPASGAPSGAALALAAAAGPCTAPIESAGGGSLWATCFPFVLAVAQGHVERALLACLQEQYGVRVEWGAKLTALQQLRASSTAGICAIVERQAPPPARNSPSPAHMGPGMSSVSQQPHTRISASFLCACDGPRSTVRRLLATPFPGKRYPVRVALADVTMSWPLHDRSQVHAFFNSAGAHSSALVAIPFGPQPDMWRLVFDDSGGQWMGQSPGEALVSGAHPATTEQRAAPPPDMGPPAPNGSPAMAQNAGSGAVPQERPSGAPATGSTLPKPSHPAGGATAGGDSSGSETVPVGKTEAAAFAALDHGPPPEGGWEEAGARAEGRSEEREEAERLLMRRVEAVVRELAHLPGGEEEQLSEEGGGQGKAGSGGSSRVQVRSLQWHSLFHMHCRRVPSFLADLPAPLPAAEGAAGSAGPRGGGKRMGTRGRSDLTGGVQLPSGADIAASAVAGVAAVASKAALVSEEAPAATPNAPRQTAPPAPPPRVLFLGDAAHIHSPVGGQGMNAGMQDAGNAAWKLALLVRGVAGAEVLQSFDRERGAIMDEVLKATDFATQAVFLPGPLVPFARSILFRLIPFLPALRTTILSSFTQLSFSYPPGRLVLPTHTPLSFLSSFLPTSLFSPWIPSLPRFSPSSASAGDRAPDGPLLLLTDTGIPDAQPHLSHPFAPSGPSSSGGALAADATAGPAAADASLSASQGLSHGTAAPACTPAWAALSLHALLLHHGTAHWLLLFAPAAAASSAAQQGAAQVLLAQAVGLAARGLELACAVVFPAGVPLLQAQTFMKAMCGLGGLGERGGSEGNAEEGMVSHETVAGLPSKPDAGELSASGAASTAGGGLRGLYACQDRAGCVARRYGAAGGGLWVVRPDGCLAAQGRDWGARACHHVMEYFNRLMGT